MNSRAAHLVKIRSLALTRNKLGRFIKGVHSSTLTEFKKGNISWSKLHPDYQSGNKHWNWKGGKPKCSNCEIQLGSYKAKRCNRCASLIFRSAEKNPRWNGGTTPLRKLIRELPEYSFWRKSVFTRDNFKCVLCGCGKSGQLNADHFPIAFAIIIKDYNVRTSKDALNCKKLWDINNGRTLCIACHKTTDNYMRRWL